MKKKKIWYLLTVICVLAAGICYSRGRTRQADPQSQTLILELDTRQTEEGAEGQNGLISAETETGEEPSTEGDEAPKESLPRQTESVRFYVHICGEVQHPGVYEMEPGTRVFQAVDMAGGFTDEAAADYLNMAQETADGMKITVPSKEEAKAEGLWVQVPESPEGAAGQQKINLTCCATSIVNT